MQTHPTHIPSSLLQSSAVHHGRHPGSELLIHWSIVSFMAWTFRWTLRPDMTHAWLGRRGRSFATHIE